MKLAKLDGGPEIFHTLQGEGLSVGRPAVFVRASRCNLHCVWCDTCHTWNFEGTPWRHEKDEQTGYAKHRKDEVTCEITPLEVATRVLEYPCELLVITGGEPLLQQTEFLEMIRLLRNAKPDMEVEVETNGTLRPSPEFFAEISAFNVSPKLTNSGIPETLRLRDEALEFFAHCASALFKFVVCNEGDLLEIRRLQERFDIPNRKILLMPEGREVAELDVTAAALAQCCRDNGYRFGDRLHIRLWGSRRGV